MTSLGSILGAICGVNEEGQRIRCGQVPVSSALWHATLRCPTDRLRSSLALPRRHIAPTARPILSFFPLWPPSPAVWRLGILHRGTKDRSRAPKAKPCERSSPIGAVPLGCLNVHRHALPALTLPHHHLPSSSSSSWPGLACICCLSLSPLLRAERPIALLRDLSEAMDFVRQLTLKDLRWGTDRVKGGRRDREEA